MLSGNIAVTGSIVARDDRLRIKISDIRPKGCEVNEAYFIKYGSALAYTRV
jgi:hypothetical protein